MKKYIAKCKILVYTLFIKIKGGYVYGRKRNKKRKNIL